MKESLRDLMTFLNDNGEVIYYSLMGTIVVILTFALFRAHKAREDFVYLKAEKSMSSLEYFVDAASRGEEANDEDYFKYREEFEVGEPEEEAPTRFEYLVETYCPKLIMACVVSLVLMGLVAAPYLVMEYFV